MNRMNPFRLWAGGSRFAVGTCSVRLIVLCLLAGFFPAHSAPDISAAQRAAIYGRGTNEFANGFYYKPVGEQNPGPSFELAPLLIQQVEPNAAVARQGIAENEFGTPIYSNGVLAVSSLQPTVYWSVDAVQVNGNSHRRFAYVWCYSEKGGARAETGVDVQVQGIRITCDAKGQPCVWEVLRDQSGADLIFVSSTLEAMARAEFGEALPQRRHAIERSITEAPDVIVPRIIQHSPTVMGPWVYLDVGSHDVGTLICRCMPAQVKKVTGSREYTLTQALNSPEFSSLTELMSRAKVGTAFWPCQSRDAGRLEKRLRLPKDF